MSPTGLEPATYGLKVHRSARWAKETTAQVSRICPIPNRFYSHDQLFLPAIRWSFAMATKNYAKKVAYPCIVLLKITGFFGFFF